MSALTPYQNSNLTNSGQPTLFLNSTNANGVFGQQPQPVMFPQCNQFQATNKTGFLWPSTQQQAKKQQLPWKAPQGTNLFGQSQTNKAVTFPTLGVQQTNVFGHQQPSVFGQQQQQPSMFVQQQPQQQPSIFGQQQQQQPNVFGPQQQQPNVFGPQQQQQQQPSIFGQQQKQPNIFGQQQQQPNIFGQQQQQPNIFGQQQQQPNIFGQQQQQPNIFGQQQQQQQQQPIIFGQQQQQPNIFGQQQQQQPSNFGLQQQQPSIVGQQQQQPIIFGQQQQQPSIFGLQQQQPNINTFGNQQPSIFGVQQPSIFGQQQQQPTIFGHQPQFGQQHFAFAPTNQQVPENFPQQFVLTQVIDQNGQVSMSVIQVPYNAFANAQPQPNAIVPCGSDWNKIGMLPAATLNSAVNGRGPSLFSTDPTFNSPLYTWKRNNDNWRRYPDGLNPSVASTFVDPPGLWTLPSAASYFPKHSPVKDRHNFMDRSHPTPNSLFEERDFAFQHWNNALKKSPSSESVKKSPFLGNTERYQRFKLAYDNNDDILGRYPEGSFSCLLRRDDDDTKRLSPQLVRAMESLRAPRKKYSLDNPPYKLGQRLLKDQDKDKYSSPNKPSIELIRSSSNKESSGSPRSLGLFDQPVHGKTPCFLKTPSLGPPKDNSFEYCSEDPWRMRQKIYNQLLKESRLPDYGARLPKTVYGESPRAKTRIWEDPL